ncbi:protein FAM227A-like isoform X1 [Bolinopsis microptera]|uniref:protein FAM227A-like isoform X1 n=2 Tax=Bolinopsis microptera TaxID=2820187 RepID=UPI00307A0707
MEVKKQVVKPSVWNLLERKIAPLWVNDDREDVILAKIQKEEAEERELAKATPQYQIGNMRDVCRMLIDQHKEPKLDFAPQQTRSKSKIEQEEQQQDTGLKKLIFVEMEEYPGFFDTPCDLPQKVETQSIMRIVTSSIRITEKPGLMREWKDFFFSEESQDILHDLFWWFFLKKFQKPPPESLSFVYERELREKTSLLFGRVARTYTMLLNGTFRLINREKLLLQYPNAIAQAIYAAYCHAFPVSWRRYDTPFKQDVLETVNLWMTGTKPSIRHWLYWDYSKLEPPNMRKDSIDKDANNQKQKVSVRDKSSVDSILTFPSTSGKLSPGLARDKQTDKQSHKGDNSHTSLSSSRLSKQVTHDTSRKNLSVHGSVSPAAGRAASVSRHPRSTLHTLPRLKGKRNIESHSAEPGPDFVLTKFDLSGHSPLVEYCLREQNLAKDVGISKLLNRKEISSYPSLEGQTYRQLISKSRTRVKEITRDMNKYWEECRRLHIRTTNDNLAQRLEYQHRSGKLLDNTAVVSKLAEMIVYDRLHGTTGAAAKISSTIDSLIALQEEQEEKQLHSHS